MSCWRPSCVSLIVILWQWPRLGEVVSALVALEKGLLVFVPVFAVVFPVEQSADWPCPVEDNNPIQPTPYLSGGWLCGLIEGLLHGHSPLVD